MSQSQPPCIGIIGAGVAGLSAAYDLLGAGYEVTLFEADDHSGGLAAGFRDERWEWPLERFYHHLFQSDRDIIGLVEELGIGDKLFWPSPVTSIWYENQIYPFSNPVDWFKFPGYSPLDFVRFGAVGAFIRFTRFWRLLERVTAVEWTRRWYGRRIYELSWKPLLISKFGPYYRDVNMAWLWARLYVRSFKLGYFEGGFQTFVDRLTQAVEERGGQIRLRAPVGRIEPAGDGQLMITTGDEDIAFDAVLSTTSPGLLARMAPGLPDSYLAGLRDLKSMGAAVLVLALKHSLLENTYWLNLPTETADKAESAIPFAALIEHTNYIDRKHYGGDHIIYCGDYVVPEHPYLHMGQAALEERFLNALPLFNPAFKPDWVRKSWLFRTPYAQPVPLVNHSQNIPPIRAPMPGLYFASMSQVYPWDRGTNYAVQIGRRAARIILEDAHV